MSIKASNNPFPHDPDDNWRDKLDRGGYTGTAQDLKNDIDVIAYPDDILVKGEIVKTGNDISIAAFEFTCRIDQVTYTNSVSYSATIAAAIEGFHRIDILVFTKFSTIVKIQGSEDPESAQEPDTPEGTIKIGLFVVYGGEISEPEIPDFSVFVDRTTNQNIKGEKTFEDKSTFKASNSSNYITILNDVVTFFKNQLLPSKGSVSLTAANSAVGNFIQQLQGKTGVIALLEDIQNIGTAIAAAPEKSTIDDNDKIVISDIQDSNKTKFWKFSTVKTTLKNYFDTLYQKIFGIINVSGTTYQLLLSDNGNKIVSSNASAVSLTIPTNAVVPFPIGARIKVTQQGDGVITLNVTGLTIIPSSTLTTIKGQTITLEKTAINTWTIEGNYLNGEVRLPAYPNTRNDGQIPVNRVLGTDANGNLKMYTMAIAPAPFMHVLIPDSNAPSITTNFKIKGAFFTPTMTVSIVGQTINYITFISDNEIDVNVSTGATEGSYAVTLNNGLSATFPNALLIVLGTVFKPVAAEWVSVTGSINTAIEGEVHSTAYNASASAKWNKVIDITKKFSIRFNLALSPLGNFTSSVGTDSYFLSLVNVVTGVEDFKFSLRADAFPSLNVRAFSLTQSVYVYNGATGSTYAERLSVIAAQSIEFKKTGTSLTVVINNSAVYTFPDSLSNNYNLLVRTRCWDIINIKYVELI